MSKGSTGLGSSTRKHLSRLKMTLAFDGEVPVNREMLLGACMCLEKRMDWLHARVILNEDKGIGAAYDKEEYIALKVVLQVAATYATDYVPKLAELERKLGERNKELSTLQDTLRKQNIEDARLNNK